MAITLELNPNEDIVKAPHFYLGLSTDTKPTIASHDGLIEPTIGSEFRAHDTGILYITHNGTDWVEKDTIVRLEASASIDIGDVTLLAGTAEIGKLGAGSALIGKVGIDQTTPGTTNAVVEASAAAIKAAVELLDNAISGTEMQVDVVAALPAGTNAIGKLAANTGVDIGDVDILSIAAGDNNVGNVDIVTVPAPLNVTGGGVELGAIRVTLANDSTGVVSVDDNGGNLSVDDGGNILSVDWNGTVPPIGAGLEATALRVTVATDSTGVVSVDDNGTNLSIDDGGNAITVDWAGTAPPIGAGLEATALRVTLATDSTGLVSVDDNGASLTVDVGTALPAGTNAIGKLAANSGVDIGDVDVLTEPSGSGAYTTPTHTAPSIAATTTEALASNANRLYALLINDSDATIYVKLGAAAVMNQGIRINSAGGSYEMSKKLGNLYTGAINGISAAGSKILLVCEGV